MCISRLHRVKKKNLYQTVEKKERKNNYIFDSNVIVTINKTLAIDHYCEILFAWVNLKKNLITDAELKALAPCMYNSTLNRSNQLNTEKSLVSFGKFSQSLKLIFMPLKYDHLTF